HLEKGVQGPGLLPCGRGIDLECANQPQAEETFVEPAGLLGISAAISVMMQTFDHRVLRSASLKNLPPIRRRRHLVTQRRKYKPRRSTVGNLGRPGTSIPGLQKPRQRGNLA